MIIGISGKIGSGKDTVGRIIQYLTTEICTDALNEEYERVRERYTFEEFKDVYNFKMIHHNFHIKKFAGKLKQIISILTGIPVEDLEQQEVKDRVLGEEWSIAVHDNNSVISISDYNKLPDSKKTYYSLHTITVRWLLQHVGTDAMRNVIHPNIWVNALFADYVGEFVHETTTVINEDGSSTDSNYIFPKWIITDVRFPNELEAIKKKAISITIRVNRPYEINIDKGQGNITTVKYDENNPDHVALIKGHLANQHPSETALDDAVFDYVIDNNSTIEELVEKVREILIKEKVIQ